MSEQTVRQLIVDYLGKAVLMQVATVSGIKPWVCSVYFAFDGNLSLYWLSRKDRRHSEELRTTPTVAGAIVLPHTPGDDVQGIQFEGVAKELTDISQAKKGLEVYAKRFSLSTDRVTEIISGTDGHVCYTIQPSSFVLFDEVHFPDDSRQVYTIL